MKNTTIPPAGIKIYSDRELITLLREAVQNELHMAQLLFFNRFKGYLYMITIPMCVKLPDPGEFASDIVQGTFQTVFKLTKKGKFNIPDTVKDSECKNVIKAWLGRITSFQFKKEYYKHIFTDPVDEGFLELPDKTYDLFYGWVEENEIEVPNKFRSKLREAMNKLSERDGHIIEVYADEGCINSKLHLSKNSMEYLCKLYNTTSENIRQIKSRALKTILSTCFPTTDKH